ncbi:MAG TPA: hypothetical protein VF773_11955, partial [Verrucomicrobiae bacterium]
MIAQVTDSETGTAPAIRTQRPSLIFAPTDQMRFATLPEEARNELRRTFIVLQAIHKSVNK